MMDKALSAKNWHTAFVIGLLLLITSGGVLAQATPEGGELDERPLITIESTTWTLIAYSDSNDLQTMLPGSEITISFDVEEGRVSGSAGCNNFFAGFEPDDNTISFSLVGSTLMMCQEEELMGQEQLFLAALGEANDYEIVDGQLQINYTEGQFLAFVPLQRIGSEDGAAISIDSPQSGAELDASEAIQISGTGQGLFEGNVVVRVLDANGTVLIEQPTILEGADVGIGEPGDWALELTPEVAPGAFGQIIAFSPSPRDESIMASDSVVIVFSAE